MRLIPNREERLFIATICMSIIAVLAVIGLIVVLILLYNKKKDPIISQQDSDNTYKLMRQRYNQISKELQIEKSEKRNLQTKLDLLVKYIRDQYLSYDFNFDILNYVSDW